MWCGNSTQIESERERERERDTKMELSVLDALDAVDLVLFLSLSFLASRTRIALDGLQMRDIRRIKEQHFTAQEK